MVAHQVAFGILLTDEFGEARCGEIVDVIKKIYEENDESYPNAVVDFPSDEDDQLVLGFSIALNREINIESLDKKWHQLISNMPKEMIDVCKKYELGEPNFHILSGQF